MSENDLPALFRWNERLSTLIYHAIVSLMLACAVVAIVQFGEHLVSGWRGGYLVPFGFVIAIEAMYSHRMMKRVTFFTPEWALYRGTEWVAILIVLKLSLYLLHGFNQLWIDIPLWRQSFIDNFFTGEYLFAIFVTFLIWSLAGIFSEELAKLEGDEALLKWERETRLDEQRPEVRKHLSDLILVIGGTMIFLAALIRQDWQALWGNRTPSNDSVVNILVYFVLALILLSLTQFSILRVRWSLEQIPISRNLAVRWLVYGGIFLLVLAMVAILLPTHYSVGLLDILGFLVSIILSLMSLLLLILLTPFIFLLSLLSNLFGKSLKMEPPTISPVQPPPAVAGTNSWVEVLKSVLFWLLFLGIAGYSLYYYFNRNQGWVNALRRLPLLVYWVRAWRWLRNWLHGLNQNLAAGVEAGLRRLRARTRNAGANSPWGFINLRRLSPRQRIIFYYLALIRRSSERGFPRKPSQTPYEYSLALQDHLPEVEEDLSAFTGQFVEARYSQHTITPQHASRVQRYWQRIKRAFRTVLQTGDRSDSSPDKQAGH